MGQPILLQDDWSQGMKRDFSRDQMPPNSAWNLVDYIPGLAAPLRRRQGYGRTPDSTLGGSALQIIQVAHAPFSNANGTMVVAIDEDTTLWKVSSASAVSAASAVNFGKQPPFMHRDKLIILDIDGSTGPQYYTGGSGVSALSASAPEARYGCVYKDRTVLGSTDADPNTIFFSGAGDPTNWAVSSEIAVSYPITGLAALRNSILVFSAENVERITGNTPPPGTDMLREPLFEGGTTDCRSIVNFGDEVIWANPSGVYRTDGAAVEDLTKEGGIKSYWQELLADYSISEPPNSGWVLAAGRFQDYYIICITSATATEAATLVCDVHRKVWFRFKGIKAMSFAHAYTTEEELYGGRRESAEVITLSNCFSNTSEGQDLGSGTGIFPELETPYYLLGSQGEKSIKRVYLRYMCEEVDGAGAPELRLSYITTPHVTSYTALSTDFPPSDTITRKRKALGFSALGVAFKLAQVDQFSEETHIHAIEVEAHPREGSRV